MDFWKYILDVAPPPPQNAKKFPGGGGGQMNEGGTGQLAQAKTNIALIIFIWAF